MPLWWGKVNKRMFHPRAVRSGKWQVIHHVGRRSGRPYRTPLEARSVLLSAREAFERLPPDAQRPPRLLRIDEFLAMRRLNGV